MKSKTKKVFVWWAVWLLVLLPLVWTVSFALLVCPPAGTFLTLVCLGITAGIVFGNDKFFLRPIARWMDRDGLR